jgi:branched-subunit amino acid transport protein AzlD
MRNLILKQFEKIMPFNLLPLYVVYNKFRNNNLDKKKHYIYLNISLNT